MKFLSRQGSGIVHHRTSCAFEEPAEAANVVIVPMAHHEQFDGARDVNSDALQVIEVRELASVNATIDSDPNIVS
jgi:hypothetical protein